MLKARVSDDRHDIKNQVLAPGKVSEVVVEIMLKMLSIDRIWKSLEFVIRDGVIMIGASGNDIR